MNSRATSLLAFWETTLLLCGPMVWKGEDIAENDREVTWPATLPGATAPSTVFREAKIPHTASTATAEAVAVIESENLEVDLRIAFSVYGW